MKPARFMRCLLLVFACTCLICLQGCALRPVTPSAPDQIYGLPGNDSLFSQYAPLIAPQQPKQEYNQIGRAAARLDPQGQEDIYIANDQPAYYVRKQFFTGKHGAHYVNLIYRVLFPYVPQPHLTAGKNVGLFVIITLDEQQRPLLITTIHSCGCYLAMVPTSYLATIAYPPDWDEHSQTVYGEQLPGRLSYPADFNTDIRPLITLRSGTHRVMDIQLARSDQITTAVELLPADSLDRLPLGNSFSSFFHESGRLKGYVKGASKPWEFLLMSWWSLDLNVGRDKKLGDPADTGTVFYTSLKPWARDASNLWFFADFLEYWGWQL